MRTISAANRDKRKHIRHSNAQDLPEIIFHLGCRAHVFGPMVVVGQLDIATARDQLLPSAHYAALLHGGFNATWASGLVRLTMQTTLKIEMPRIATSQEFVRGIDLTQGDPEAAATHLDCLDMIKTSLLNKWCGREFGCPIPDSAERICLEWHADNIFIFANSTGMLPWMLDDLIFELQITNYFPKPSSLSFTSFGSDSTDRVAEIITVNTIYGDIVCKRTRQFDFLATSINEAADAKFSF